MKLDASSIRQYEDEGYVVLPRMYDAAGIAELQGEAQRLAGLSKVIHTSNLRCRWADHVETKECRFDCFDPVTDLSSVIAQAARAPQLMSALSQLLREAARLFKDKLIYKPPGAPGYDLHQDWIAWEGFPRSFLTVIVAIDPATAEAGATEVFPRLHKKGCLSPQDGEFHRLGAECVADVAPVPLLLQPGDAAVFSGFAPHRSGPNRSTQSRRLLYLSYNAHSDGGDLRDSHYEQFQAFLREKYAQFGRREVYFQ